MYGGHVEKRGELGSNRGWEGEERESKWSSPSLGGSFYDTQVVLC